MLRLQLSREKRNETEEKNREVKLRQASCWKTARPAPVDGQYHRDSVIPENQRKASAEHTWFLPFNSFFFFYSQGIGNWFQIYSSQYSIKTSQYYYGKKKKKIPWRREWQPTPIFLPGESQGQRSLTGYSLWGWKELDMTEWLTLSKQKKDSF